IDGDEYKEIKAESNQRINDMEKRLSALGAAPERKMDTIVDKAVQTLCNIDELYKRKDIETKRKIVGSIYPENLVISETGYRTARVNRVIEVMCLINNKLKGHEKEKSAR